MSSPAMPGQTAGQTTGTARTYIGWQQEKVAFVFGLSGQRAAMIAAAVLAAIIPITATRLAEGLVTWPVAGLLAAAAFTRIGGRTADEWLAAAVSWGLLAFRGQHRFNAAVPSSQGSAAIAQSQAAGLDAAHNALLSRLRGRLSWPRDDFTRAAAELGLLPDGALETLNEAAFEAVGEPVCEGSDPIEINHDAIEEMLP